MAVRRNNRRLRVRLAGAFCGIASVTALAICGNACLRQNRWAAPMERGYQAYAARHYDAAEIQYRQALNVARAFGENDLRIGRTLNRLALVLVGQQRYGEAETLFQQSLAIADAGGKAGERDKANGLNNLGWMRLRERRYAEAENCLRESLTLKEKYAEPLSPELRFTIRNLGHAYWHQRRFGQALLCNRRALEIEEKASGPQSRSAATEADFVGNALMALRRPNQAEAMYRRVLAIREATLGPSHPDVAVTLDKLAHAHFDEHRYQTAEQEILRAVQIKSASFGATALPVAASLRLYAPILWKMGRRREASATEARIRTIYARRDLLNPRQGRALPDSSNASPSFSE